MVKNPNPKGDEWEIPRRRYKIWIIFFIWHEIFYRKNVIFL